MITMTVVRVGLDRIGLNELEKMEWSGAVCIFDAC